ncbi:MAG: tryptophan halogenase family protein [Pseudomonadales bacterium]
MQEQAIKRVVIAGGGTAGWMAAAAISKLMGKNLEITLVESEMIGTIGVGEATIPTMVFFNRLLGIKEADFMRAVEGTYKLGIQFENWGGLDEDYIHAFGVTGKDCWACGFQHFWLRGKQLGISEDFGDYCLERAAAEAHKFAHLPKNGLNYAFHIDASLYAAYLRKMSEQHGVVRQEGKISKVNLNPSNGYIESLDLDNGKQLAGDFFIDCTGMRALLIEQALHTGYESWSQWLPCDSAVAIQTKSVSAPIPYTRSIARESGWQWRIPLQHRVGNGIVYCSRYMDKDEAEQTLLENVEGETLTKPLHIKFSPGRRRKQWTKNCLAVGLSSGFLEPLESTSIHLIQQNIVRFLRMFPSTGIQQSEVDEFNKQADFDVERIRDFIILHYKATERTDTEFWRHCKSMDIPDSLEHRIRIFKETGHVFREAAELFDDSWQQVMIGQGIMPDRYHALVDAMSVEELTQFLQQIKTSIDSTVNGMPMHKDYIRSLATA